MDLLSDREQAILDAIVRNFILNAVPTSSRFLSRQRGFNLSAATIRNSMSDLEEQGFIEQPHTSAGRVPTDKGYRYYVDKIMHYVELPEQVRQSVRSALVAIDRSDLHALLEAASKALSRITGQLGVILAPRLCKGIFNGLHVFEVAQNRYLLNVAIDSGLVKTMIVEFQTRIPFDRLECACRIINTNYQGMELERLFEKPIDRIHGATDVELGIIRLLVPSLKKLIENENDKTLFTEGETHIIKQLDFFDRHTVGALIEILEERQQMLMHLFETPNQGEREVLISIGEENHEGQLQSFSIIKTTYRVGNLSGSLGVIGPKRMPYPLLVSAVDYTSRVISEIYS